MFILLIKAIEHHVYITYPYVDISLLHVTLCFIRIDFLVFISCETSK